MPDKQSRGYSLIVGEHGTGKSSLIQLAINELKLPKGIVYLTIPNTDDVDVNPLLVVETLRKAFGWTKDEADRLGATATLELLEAFGVFSDVAKKYQTAFQEIPVLIIDNSNRLPSTILAQFQDFAKEAADEGIAKLVFVTSEGRVPRAMRERSAWSRKQSVLEIGDVSEKEALYYMKSRGVDRELAESVYALVGGRMVLLKYAVNNLNGGVSLNDIQQDLFDDARAVLYTARVLPDGLFHKEGGETIATLLEDGGAISYETYVQTVKKEEIAKTLLQGNLFSYHLSNRTVTFQSTPMEKYCRENWSFHFGKK